MRNFYQHQDDARGMTKALCLLLALSVVGTIVASAVALAGVAVVSARGYLSATTNITMPFSHWRALFLDRFVQAMVLSTLAIVGVAIYKTFQLAEGGGRLVARSLGGTRVLESAADFAHRVLLNVVEEMAIATGLPTPPVYVLEGEPGINAFAAGFDSKDTVIGVTRGAIDRLKRHQLQGIIAHEFGHIAQDDVCLNIRLVGVLTGIQSITFVSKYLMSIALASSKDARSSIGKNPLGMALSLIFGLVLWPIGQVGSIFAHLINLGVNRQREFLADACAVEYTRDPHGLCDALEAIRDDEIGSRMQGPAARLAGHMFFAGVGAWRRLYQTHPPLDERIRRLNCPTVAPDRCGVIQTATREVSIDVGAGTVDRNITASYAIDPPGWYIGPSIETTNLQ
jgi:Zn-dependent protease with chaperone function